MKDTFSAWLTAIRPHTFPASISPVLVGNALALRHDFFNLLVAISSFLVALLLQTAVNLANDYFDYKNDVDTDERQGFERACASGLLPPEQVRNATMISLLFSILPGLYLVTVGGIPLLMAGIASLVAALTYSGGPLPYGSIGLGDFMVFIFFGLVATSGTFYVHVCSELPTSFPLLPPPGSINIESLIAGASMGAICTIILVINNLRDRPQDLETNKYTLAVILGDRGSQCEIGVLFVISYLIPLIYWSIYNYSIAVILPYLTLPIAIRIFRDCVKFKDRSDLNKTLKRTTILLGVYSVFISLGFVL